MFSVLSVGARHTQQDWRNKKTIHLSAPIATQLAELKIRQASKRKKNKL